MNGLLKFLRDTPYNSEAEEETSPRRSLRPIFSPSQSGREWGEEIVFGHNPPNKYDIPSSSRHDTRVASPDHLKTKDDAIQQKIHEVKDLFSGNKIEITETQRNLIKEFSEYSANELKSAKEYINLAEKFPKTFSITRDKTLHDAIKGRLEGMSVNTQNDNIEILFSGDETKIQDFKDKFIIGLTTHFMQELKAAKELFEWAKTFTKPFGSDEKWVQDGIKQQLAIAFKKSQIESNKPSMANAKLLKENIREALKDGIPVKEIPDRICGRKVTQVSGKGNDCLIRALLKGAHPKYFDYVIEDKVQDMRKLLIEKKMAKEGAMLDLGSEEGKKLIKYMKRRGYLKHGRNLLVYQYRDGRMQCISMTDKRSNKPPYAILLDFKGEHFYAVEVPG